MLNFQILWFEWGIAANCSFSLSEDISKKIRSGQIASRIWKIVNLTSSTIVDLTER